MADEPVSDMKISFKRWRDEVWQLHPDANRMPEATAAEQQQVTRDIESNGLENPVEFRIEGDFDFRKDAADERITLFDGRTRMNALERLGYRFAHPKGRGPLMRDPNGNVEELYCFHKHANEVPFPFQRVVSLNISRRHLSGKQKRAVIEQLLLDMPELSDREIARTAGVDNKTATSVRRYLEDLGKLEPQEATVGHDNVWRTTTPRRATRPPVGKPPTVEVEKERLARLAGARSRDGSDLYDWAKDGSQKIAHVLVTEGCMAGSLRKVQEVARAMAHEADRLETEAIAAKRAEAERGAPPALAGSVFGGITRRAYVRILAAAGERLGKEAVAAVRKMHHGGRHQSDRGAIFGELTRMLGNSDPDPGPGQAANSAPE